MVSVSPIFEDTIHQALTYASDHKHKQTTPEHLLIALLDDKDAAAVIMACDVDIEALRMEITQYLDDLVVENFKTSLQTASFRRVIEQAFADVQLSGREEVNGADVLVGLYASHESYAVYLLLDRKMTRYDVLRYISHGIAKNSVGLVSKPISETELEGGGNQRARVLLRNDNYTPMEFVVSILIEIFNKTSKEAKQIMLDIHQTGIGTCGAYTFEIAESKVAQVMDAAKRNQHPLQCTLEKA